MTSNYYSHSNTLNSNAQDNWIGRVVCKNYRIISKLNEGFRIIVIFMFLGSFGKIYKAVHQEKNDFYAVKIENNSKKKDGETLLLEAQILFNLKGEKGFPRLYFYVQDGQNRTLVETLLDRNLDELFNQCDRRFSLKTVLLFMDQALNRLEYLHKNNYVHRDIKPENFMVGLPPEQETIYLIDFGLSMLYINKDGQHIKQQKGQHMVGTARFTPICSHQGMTQNRASDLESLGYLVVYFLKGSLPWMNIQTKTRDERFHQIGMRKMQTSTDSLCEGLPQEFNTYFNYISNLAFQSEPSYAYIRKTFRKLFLLTHQKDERFDWTREVDMQDNMTENIKYTPDQIISERNSSEERDQVQISGCTMKDSGGTRKKESWCKSISLHVPNQTMKESRYTCIYIPPSKSRKNINQESPIERQMKSQVVMERKDQHNSLLSSQDDVEIERENITFDEENEYHPFLPLKSRIEQLTTLIIQTRKFTYKK